MNGRTVAEIIGSLAILLASQQEIEREKVHPEAPGQPGQLGKPDFSSTEGVEVATFDARDAVDFESPIPMSGMAGLGKDIT